MTTWTIIYNPTSGHFRQDRLEAVCNILRGAGIEPLPQPTQYAGHAVELARAAKGVDRVVAHGGDGTLNEVATGMLGEGKSPNPIPLAFLPGGTANAMAFELGIPCNPVRAVERLLRAEPKQVRPGLVDGRPFMLMASFGFDALAVYMVKGAVKAKLGASAYLAMGVRALWHPKPQITVTLPDGTQHTGVWVVGSRARRYGGRLYIHPKASLRADNLGVTTIRKAAIAPFAFTHLLFGVGWNGGGINLSQAREFSVEAQQPVHVQVDGEYLHQGTKFQVSQAEQPIQFCIPQPRA